MKNLVRSFGFSLIELLVVLVILGLSVSVVAPDMFKMLERVQKREEQTTISETLKLMKEKSFFSVKSYFITFKDNKFSAYEYTNEQSLYTVKELELICKAVATLGQGQLPQSNNKEDMASYEADMEENARCSKLKQVYSQFYTFEELSFLVSGGKVDEPQLIKFFESNASPSFILEVD